jgi:hypothetical protein
MFYSYTYISCKYYVKRGKPKKWNKEDVKTCKLQFNSLESLQTFIFSVQFYHGSGIFIKMTIGHRNSIKILKIPFVNWT